MSSIKIIGQDLGFDLDIRAFIERFPELCHKGVHGKEFAFHVTRENLKTISGVMGFTAAFHLDLGQQLQNEYPDDSRAMLSFHRWNDTPEHSHCIVFLTSYDQDRKFLAIDPALNDYISLPVNVLERWQCNSIEVKCG